MTGQGFENRRIVSSMHCCMSKMHCVHATHDAKTLKALPDLVSNMLSSEEARAHISVPSSSPQDCTGLYVTNTRLVTVLVPVSVKDILTMRCLLSL